MQNDRDRAHDLESDRATAERFINKDTNRAEAHDKDLQAGEAASRNKSRQA